MAALDTLVLVLTPATSTLPYGTNAIVGGSPSGLLRY